MTEKLYASIQTNNKFHTDIYGNNHECNIHITLFLHTSSITSHIPIKVIIHVMCVHNTFYDRKLSTSMCDTSQVLLAGVPGGFSRGFSCFCPYKVLIGHRSRVHARTAKYKEK